MNSAWGGYEDMVEDGEFTWPHPFWLQPMWRWEAMMDAGVRAAYFASRLAARLMVPAELVRTEATPAAGTHPGGRLSALQ